MQSQTRSQLLEVVAATLPVHHQKYYRYGFHAQLGAMQQRAPIAASSQQPEKAFKAAQKASNKRRFITD